MIPQVRMTEYLNTLDVDLEAEDTDPIGLRNQKVKEDEAANLARSAVKEAFDFYKKEIGKPNLVFENLSESEKEELKKNPIFRDKLRDVRAEQNKDLNRTQGNAR